MKKYKLIVSNSTETTHYFDTEAEMDKFASTTFGYLSAYCNGQPIGFGTYKEGYLYGQV